MSKIQSYMDKKELKFSVTVGRKTYKGYATAMDALQAGIEKVQFEDSRAWPLLAGKSLDRQVGIIFGADVQQKYFQQHN